MFEFCGELSNPCKLYVQKLLSKGAVIVASCTMFLFSIPIIVFSIILHWIICLFLIIPILILIFVAIPSMNAPMRTLNLYLPRQIISNNEFINLYSDKLSKSRPLSAVKKVIDKGEWYYIIFCFPHKDPYYLCQKNLITKGTIEDFEKLFEGKIERKL